MNSIILFFIVVAIVGLAVAGLATTILLKKNGQFPNTHVGGNAHMLKRGIICAKRYDAQEQAKVKRDTQFKQLRPVLGVKTPRTL